MVRRGARTYAHLAELPVQVDDWSLSMRERETSSEFTRKTTVFTAAGGRHVGRGEDVTYAPEAHDTLLEHPPAIPLDGEYTLARASQAIDDANLFPVEPPERAVFRNYRRWGIESALLDLALRQAETDLASVLDREAAPVRFVVSTSLGEPPTPDPVTGWLDIDPSLEFKVDATKPWPEEMFDAFVEADRIRTIDLKAHYVDEEDDEAEADESWQGRPDARFYRRLLESFPEAVIEDPGVTDDTQPILASEADRLSWDAPIHSVADFEALPLRVGWCNVKPSRFGTLERLFDFIDYARSIGLRLYGGGQFELSVGRGQLHALASLFYPDGPNDVAPRPYNDPRPRSGLPTSPLAPPDRASGFGWPPPEES